MKVRSSFVSNSSSSSYIVTIKNTSQKELLDNIMDSMWSWPEDTIGYIEDRIDSLKEVAKVIEGKCVDKNVVEKSFVSFDNEVKKLHDLLDQVKNGEPEELFNAMFDCYDVKVEDQCGDLVLSQYTVMHNDFNEGMEDFLKEIVLILLFDSDKEVICNRSED